MVGCGGTGGFIAEGLCRILHNSNVKIILIDHDRVEPHNLIRQNFYEGDVGKFKSQALAERLSRLYGCRIDYSVYPYDRELIYEYHGAGMYSRAIQGIIIGCVDNAAARREIAETINPTNMWIDAGNGYASGQVLIGNCKQIDEIEGGFDQETGEVCRLPAPSWQLPSLLAPTTKPMVPAMDCAEAVAAEEQSPVINQAMATLVLEFIYRLLRGELTWMGAYLDLGSGTLQTVPAEPVTVARMIGVKVDNLIAQNCAIGRIYRFHGR